MKINVPNRVFTHEGAPAVQVDAYQQLRRTVLACLLFEDQFYEDGKSIADRIKELCVHIHADKIFELALDAAINYKLRHVPLQLIVEGLKHRNTDPLSWQIIEHVITRPDQMTDLLALYWKDGKKPLPHKLKRALAYAFHKFDEYQLSKYNRDNPIKLRDVLFLCHAKPANEAEDALWKRLINGTLATADTWETRLSGGADKKESFEELLKAKKLGKLAILRNLRNMKEAGISKEVVSSELNRNMKEMLPFQYLAAARECPQWEDIIDPAMVASAALKPKLKGKTIVLVDVSGSMDQILSGKSVMTRMDAACGLAILLRECCEAVEIYTFSVEFKPIPPRNGMALRDAIVRSQPHSGTLLGNALIHIKTHNPHYDRLVVITDEQSHDAIPYMNRKNNYILNIGSYQNGIGAKNEWLTITGFSEASIDFIRELENFD